MYIRMLKKNYSYNINLQQTSDLSKKKKKKKKKAFGTIIFRLDKITYIVYHYEGK